MLEHLEARRLLSAGDQDLSYGTTGFFQANFGEAEYQFLPGSDPHGSATVIAMSADGKSFTVRGFNDGVPANGLVASQTLPFTTESGERASPRRVWNLSTGKTVVEFVAPAKFGGAFDGYFIRLNANKILDTTFGSGGFHFWRGGFPLEAVQQGDKLVAITGGVSVGKTVERFSFDGTPDTTWGDNGVVNIERYPRNLLVQDDGKILVSAAYASTPKVYRFTVDGDLDTSFGGGDGKGVGSILDALRGMAFDSHGRIVLSGPNGYTRLTADGLLDTTFGDNGLAEPFDNFENAGTEGEVLIGDGTMIAPFGARRFVRIDEDGNYDAAFGEPVVNLFRFEPAVEEDLSNQITYSAQEAKPQSDGSVLISRRFSDGRFIEVRIEGSGATAGPVQGDASGITVTGSAGRDLIQFDPTFFGFADATIGVIGRRVKLDPTAIFHADGGAGNDIIEVVSSGTAYGSTITGGEGNDRLIGGKGADSLSGNAGKDTIKGGDGNDRLAGNGGRDRLFGGVGDDRLFGGASGDWLYGEFGNDQLNGEGGDDRLYSDDVHESEVDTLHGNAGNDQFVTKDGLVDEIFGDGGSDSAFADANDLKTSIESLG